MQRTSVLGVILKVVGALALLYVVIVVLAWKYQDRLAFPGPNMPLPSPHKVGIPDGERMTVRTDDDVTLYGWYLPPDPQPPPGRAAPGLLWFYGNMETVGGLAPILRDFRPPGTGMLVLDYRGYGENEGTPTEWGLYRDGEAAWRYLTARPEIDSMRIAAYGRSLGSAVALYLATAYPIRAVILDSPFSSAADMADVHYAFLPSSLLHLELDNVSRARALDVPLLVFHGTADRVAPFWMGRAVAEAGRAEELVTLQGTGHNDTYDADRRSYVERVHEFLNRYLM